MKRIGLAHLVEAYRRGNIGQVVFETRGDDLIIPRPLARIAFQASREIPCSDMIRIRSAYSSLSVHAIPPSPVVMALLA